MIGRVGGAILVAGAVLVAASAGGAQEYEAARDATVPAAGATVMRLDARAGSLRIEGQNGIGEVRIRGTARASSRELLEGIKLEANRDGNEVRVEVVIPEIRESGWDHQAALDLVIEVPASLPLDVRDSSGDVEIRNVARLDIDDRSRDLNHENDAGALNI